MGFKIVEDLCTPQCRANVASPVVRGIRLGMSLDEFKSKFPFVEINRLHRNLLNYKTAYVWAWDWDAYSTSVTFVDDKVARIEVQFHSLKNGREREDFYQLISQKIGMTQYWPPYNQGWDCKDFIVEVTPNIDPTITIQTKDYLRVRDKLNEEFLKRLK
jgi:hypothetical protein